MDIPDSVKQRFHKTETITHPSQRKLRNSCVTGHRAWENGQPSEDELKCSWCRKARFNTLLTGYHADSPTIAQVETFLIKRVPPVSLADFAFVLDYLGIDIVLDESFFFKGPKKYAKLVP